MEDYGIERQIRNKNKLASRERGVMHLSCLQQDITNSAWLRVENHFGFEAPRASQTSCSTYSTSTTIYDVKSLVYMANYWSAKPSREYLCIMARYGQAQDLCGELRDSHRREASTAEWRRYSMVALLHSSRLHCCTAVGSLTQRLAVFVRCCH